MAGCDQAKVTIAGLIMDSGSTTGLRARDYYKFGHWQRGHCRGGKNKY